eukprot:7259955-Prymnesium_polylepis.1
MGNNKTILFSTFAAMPRFSLKGPSALLKTQPRRNPTATATRACRSEPSATTDSRRRDVCLLCHGLRRAQGGCAER